MQPRTTQLTEACGGGGGGGGGPMLLMKSWRHTASASRAAVGEGGVTTPVTRTELPVPVGNETPDVNAAALSCVAASAAMVMPAPKKALIFICSSLPFLPVVSTR